MKTDLKKIKDFAKLLLRLSYRTCKEIPPEIHIYHPFYSSVLMFNGKKYLDLRKQEELNEIIEYMEKTIDESDLLRIYTLINKPYRLFFIKEIEQFLSDKDLAEYLADAWVSSENPNQDANCSISFLTKFFKRCNKQYLMTAEDYKIYTSLPETLVLYRGVAVGHNPKGLSWTQSFETAKWFAQRYDTDTNKGYILTVTVPKTEVLAYFNTRDEDEIVCNANKYEKERIEL